MSPKDIRIVYFEYGELYADKDELGAIFLGKKMKAWERKLGKFKSVGPISTDPRHKGNYHIMYKYYPNSPRTIAYKRRMAIKNSLPKEGRIFARWARSMSKAIFLTKVPHEAVTMLKNAGYKSVEQFWQVNNNKKMAVPG